MCVCVCVPQASIETVSKTTLGKRLRDGMERISMKFSGRIGTILKRTGNKSETRMTARVLKQEPNT